MPFPFGKYSARPCGPRRPAHVQKPAWLHPDAWRVQKTPGHHPLVSNQHSLGVTQTTAHPEAFEYDLCVPRASA